MQRSYVVEDERDLWATVAKLKGALIPLHRFVVSPELAQRHAEVVVSEGIVEVTPR